MWKMYMQIWADFYEVKCSSIDFGGVPNSQLSSLAIMLKIELKVLPFFGWKFSTKKGKKPKRIKCHGHTSSLHNWYFMRLSKMHRLTQFRIPRSKCLFTLNITERVPVCPNEEATMYNILFNKFAVYLFCRLR